ncbi:MAG: hypothetical protein JSR77_12930 [Planctomycetes bacterium]|nr:hypothetical protein [Planctomycetota bacterium]
MDRDTAVGGLWCALAALGLAGSAGAQSCEGLVAHWSFNGGSFQDQSGRGNHLTNFGCAVEPGKYEEALNVSPSSFAQAANSASLNPGGAMSVAAWYRPVVFSGTGNDPIVDKGYYGHSSPYYQYHMGVSGLNYPNPGSFEFGVAVNGVYRSAGTPYNFYQAGRWYFLVGTYDGSAVRFYADGVLLQSNPVSGAISTYATAVRVGRFDNLGSSCPGTIDEVRIFERAISADEVRVLFEHPDGSPLLEPAAATTCASAGTSFSVTTIGTAGVTYRWEIETGAGVWSTIGGAPLELACGGRVTATAPSAAQTLLHISPCFGVGSYRVRCVAAGPCGEAASNVSTISVCSCLECPADFNQDGGIDGVDVNDFFASWESGACDSDVNADGGVDGDDVTAFFGAWEAGGC